MIKARVGIVSWNTAELLDRCLASLPAATHDMEADIVVVDNASRDASVDICHKHGVKIVANPSNEGYASAMNKALSIELPPAGVDTLIALNPDTECPPRSLTLLAEKMLAEPDIGLVVPRLRNLDGSIQHSVYRFPSVVVAIASTFLPVAMQDSRIAKRFWLEGSSPPERPQDIDWAIGAVHVMRSTAVDGAGPYSERWFMYTEDVDLCWTLHESGWRCVYEPDIEIVHVGNASGVQAWGGDRLRRWLSCTYDWYRIRRGAWAVRCWALANTVGVSARLLVAGLHWARRRPLAAWERELKPALFVHLRALFGRVEAEFTAPAYREDAAELT